MTRGVAMPKPLPRGAVPRPLEAGGPGRAFAALWRFGRARPGLVAAVVAAVGFGSAIGWNALTQQKNRHPAPLFGARSTAALPPGLAEPPRRPDAAPAPLPVPRPETNLSASPSAPLAPDPPRAASPNDAIGTLIRTGEVPARAADPRLDPQRVSSVQKALTRLGYGPLRPDGLMGATTRQAVERFERDHKLPVTGTLGPRTTRQLASRAGADLD